MTAPLSNDLRERVVAAVMSGESVRAVAARFEVGASSVVKWSQRHRATGSVCPSKMGGHRKRILEPHRDFIVERLGQNPHLTLHGLKAELASRGITISHNTVWEFIRSEGLRFKKSCSPLSKLSPTSPVGESVGSLQQHLDPERRVFIDETLIKTSMMRIRGWDQRANVCRRLRRMATGAP